MRPINVVLAHHDPVEAQGLAESLRPQFRKLVTVSSLPEAVAAIARLRARFVIIDLELLSYSELRKLCSEFPAAVFACVHRLADEAMWAEALAVGAVDCCVSNDVQGILLASERYVPARKAAA
jgi:DNA-binding NarL/FixJ family response regulator